MNLRQAVSSCPQLAGSLQPSLQALAPAHRRSIVIADAHRLQHSLNLEAAISPAVPRMKQWDYALGWESADHRHSCCFAEVHPANTTTAADVVGKKRDVQSWLSRNASAVRQLAHNTATRLNAPVWHWLATDATIAIRKGSQASKQLAAAGISGPKRRLELD